MSNTIQVIDDLIIALTFACIVYWIVKAYLQTPQALSNANKVKLVITGIVGFFFDALGVGSYAPNIALTKQLNLFEDRHLPHMANIVQVIPGAIEAILFLNVFHVDVKTLVVLITGTCLGGVLGSRVVSRLNQSFIVKMMIVVFPFVIVLLLAQLCHLLPVTGNLIKFSGNRLILAFISMCLAGFLTAAGVGLFVMVQAFLFLLGMSPSMAFPIMTAAGAMQQPLSAFSFISNSSICLRRCLWLSLSGLIGIAIGLPLISHLTTPQLHVLLIAVLLFNTYKLSKGLYGKDLKQTACSNVKPAALQIDA